LATLLLKGEEELNHRAVQYKGRGIVSFSYLQLKGLSNAISMEHAQAA
jgi:hypothetical protein